MAVTLAGTGSGDSAELLALDAASGSCAHKPTNTVRSQRDTLLSLLCEEPVDAFGPAQREVARLGPLPAAVARELPSQSSLEAAGAKVPLAAATGRRHHDARFRACVHAARVEPVPVPVAGCDPGPGRHQAASHAHPHPVSVAGIPASLFLHGVSLQTAEPAWAARLLDSDGSLGLGDGYRCAAEMLHVPPSPIDLAPDSPFVAPRAAPAQAVVSGPGAEIAAAADAAAEVEAARRAAALAAEVAEASWPRFKATMHRAPQRFIALLAAGLLDCGAGAHLRALQAEAHSPRSNSDARDRAAAADRVRVASEPHDGQADAAGRPEAEGRPSTDAPAHLAAEQAAMGAALSSRFALHLLVAAVARPSSLRGCEEELTSDVEAGCSAEGLGSGSAAAATSAAGSVVSSSGSTGSSSGSEGSPASDHSGAGGGEATRPLPPQAPCSVRRLCRLVHLIRTALAAGANPRGADECGCEPIVAALQAEDAQLAAALMLAGAVDGNAPVFVCCGQPRIQPRPRPLTVRFQQPLAVIAGQAVAAAPVGGAGGAGNEVQPPAGAADAAAAPRALAAVGGAGAPQPPQPPQPLQQPAGAARAGRLGLVLQAGGPGTRSASGAFSHGAVATAIASAASSASMHAVASLAAPTATGTGSTGAVGRRRRRRDAAIPVPVPRQVLLETPSARALPPELRCSAAWQRLGHHCFHLAAGDRAVRPNHMSLLRYLAAYAPYAQAPLLASPPADAWWTFGQAAAAGVGAGLGRLWSRTASGFARQLALHAIGASATAMDSSGSGASGDGSPGSSGSAEATAGSSSSWDAAETLCEACGHLGSDHALHCLCDSSICCTDDNEGNNADDEDEDEDGDDELGSARADSLPACVASSPAACGMLSSTGGSAGHGGGVVACESCGELVGCMRSESLSDDGSSGIGSRMTYGDVLQLMRLAVYRCGADPIGASTLGWQSELRARLEQEERRQRILAQLQAEAETGGEDGQHGQHEHRDADAQAQHEAAAAAAAEQAAAAAAEAEAAIPAAVLPPPHYHDSMQAGFAAIAHRYFARSRSDVLTAILGSAVVGGLGDRAWARRARVVAARVRAFEED